MKKKTDVERFFRLHEQPQGCGGQSNGGRVIGRRFIGGGQGRQGGEAGGHVAGAQLQPPENIAGYLGTRARSKNKTIIIG
ncbi:unnamed protein product [Onchocerca ochengi]|uniref:Obg domain-containing protein n=1 Tax=Onchocerca ochengi TaxID=42157 RepID=A0A182EJQ7_ONCOC|nr:unnamed protein product [Onchocerca ochengi]